MPFLKNQISKYVLLPLEYNQGNTTSMDLFCNTGKHQKLKSPPLGGLARVQGLGHLPCTMLQVSQHLLWSQNISKNYREHNAVPVHHHLWPQNKISFFFSILKSKKNKN